MINIMMYIYVYITKCRLGLRALRHLYEQDFVLRFALSCQEKETEGNVRLLLNADESAKKVCPHQSPNNSPNALVGVATCSNTSLS